MRKRVSGTTRDVTDLAYLVLLDPDVSSKMTLGVFLEDVNEAFGIIQVIHNRGQRMHHRRSVRTHFWVITKFFRFLVLECFKEGFVFGVILEKPEKGYNF